MPARNDVFAITKQLLLDNGVVTVLRGIWWPGDDAIPGSALPLAAIWQSRPENIENETGGYIIDGEIGIMLWVQAQVPGGILADEPGWKVIDDIHDAILRGFVLAFDNGYTSNTTGIYPTSFTTLDWYKDSPHLGADLRITYRMGFA